MWISIKVKIKIFVSPKTSPMSIEKDQFLFET